jgi:hypothetical protein
MSPRVTYNVLNHLLITSWGSINIGIRATHLSIRNFFLGLTGTPVPAEKVLLRAVLGGLGSPNSHISILIIIPIALR